MSYELQKINKFVEIEGFNGIYYFEFGKDFSHPPERHNFWEMVYVDSGEINSITDGVGRVLSQGQVIFHAPMELHAHVSNKVVPNNMMVVTFTAHGDNMKFFDKKVLELDGTAKTLLSLFIKEAQNALGTLPNQYNDNRSLDFSHAPNYSMQLMECYLTEFLLLLLRNKDTTDSSAPQKDNSRAIATSSIIELITSYLESNVYSSITLSDICTKFYMGKSNLCKIFSENLGEGPIEYLHRMKLIEAKKLLLEGELSVSKISDMLGYSSIHNFSRAFKKSVGISPLEYKKKINHL